MTKRYIQSTCLSLITLFYVLFAFQSVSAQTAGENVTGVITESGSGLPLKQVTVQELLPFLLLQKVDRQQDFYQDLDLKCQL